MCRAVYTEELTSKWQQIFPNVENNKMFSWFDSIKSFLM